MKLDVELATTMRTTLASRGDEPPKAVVFALQAALAGEASVVFGQKNPGEDGTIWTIWAMSASSLIRVAGTSEVSGWSWDGHESEVGSVAVKVWPRSTITALTLDGSGAFDNQGEDEETVFYWTVTVGGETLPLVPTYLESEPHVLAQYEQFVSVLRLRDESRT